MRTTLTLTLESDVAERLRQEARQTGRRMKEVVNRALRIGLGLAKAQDPPPRFEVKPHSFRFKPGVDLDRMQQLLDDLETREAVRKLEAPASPGDDPAGPQSPDPRVQ